MANVNSNPIAGFSAKVGPGASKIGVPFTPYAAGRRMYGMGRDFPTAGTVDKIGYRERDALANARKDAVIRRMKAQSQGRMMQPDVLRRLG